LAGGAAREVRIQQHTFELGKLAVQPQGRPETGALTQVTRFIHQTRQTSLPEIS
jgi:hypothetical protein